MVCRQLVEYSRHLRANRLRLRNVLPFLAMAVLSIRPVISQQTDDSLRIVGAAISTAEDGQQVSQEYEFLSGDYVHVAFQIGGFTGASLADETKRGVQLEFHVTAENKDGILLAPARDGKIEEEIGTEDKNWLPKERASFMLPQFLAAGTYRVRIVIEDKIAKKRAVMDCPFSIGGPQLTPTGGLGVQNISFYRSADDTAPLELPAYRAGDAVWTRFDMVGFAKGGKNTAQLEYGVSVVGPDGKKAFDRPIAAAADTPESFYPPDFIPAALSISTSTGSSPGTYRLVVHIRDKKGEADAMGESSFRIE